MRAFLLAMPLLCAACEPYDQCDPPAPASLARLPMRLSETGLFADVPSETLGPAVLAYTPRFALWSDGAEKRRWIALPDGATIDTSDMDDWIFPEGTRFWKEFTRDGVRVETRVLEKIGPGDADWIGAAYMWNEDQSDALLTPGGAENASGTAHDVPDASRCMGCHGGRRSRVLGFSIIQLAWDEPSGVELAMLVSENRLTAPPASEATVPGDETERAALGYIHANCSHCHNQARPENDGSRCYDPYRDFDLRLTFDRLSSAGDTLTYRTAVGGVIDPGDPDGSRLIRLVSRRGDGLHMPPLATEEVDQTAVDLLRRWISAM
jgi:hypothetical protein